MLQQSIRSQLPIVKTSHRTIPYDHLQKESKREADFFGAFVVCFDINVAIRVVLCVATVVYTYMILFVIRITKQLFQVWIGYINDNYSILDPSLMV